MAIITETTDSILDFTSFDYSIAPGDTFLGMLGGIDTADEIGMTLVAGQQYTVTVTGLDPSQPFALYLFAEGGPGVADLVNSLVVSGGSAVPSGAMETFSYDPLTGDMSITFIAEISGQYALAPAGAFGGAALSYELALAPIVATTGADTLAGSIFDDTIYLLAGNDFYDALGGNDTVYGDDGDDTINGDDGDDVIDGGDGADTLNGGNGNDTLRGGNGGDTLRGDAGDDLLVGGADADDMNGGTGNDTLRGNGGDDKLFGFHGDDVIEGGFGRDKISGGQGNDLLFADSGKDTVWGNDGDDIIFGGDGNDWLHGGQGDDVIDGGTGNDIYKGDTGADVFVFAFASGRDTVLDFQDGTDILDVSLAGITGIEDLFISQSGSNALVYFNEVDRITLRDTDVADLDTSDFIFDALGPIGPIVVG